MLLELGEREVEQGQLFADAPSATDPVRAALIDRAPTAPLRNVPSSASSGHERKFANDRFLKLKHTIGSSKTVRPCKPPDSNQTASAKRGTVQYRHIWPNCRLITVEERLLGHTRVDDLPGSEAPAAWRSFLSSGATGLLRRVLDHNARDLVSLVQVLGRLCAGTT